MAQYNTPNEGKIQPDCLSITDARVCDVETTCFWNHSKSSCNYIDKKSDSLKFTPKKV